MNKHRRWHRKISIRIYILQMHYWSNLYRLVSFLTVNRKDINNNLNDFIKLNTSKLMIYKNSKKEETSAVFDVHAKTPSIKFNYPVSIWKPQMMRAVFSLYSINCIHYNIILPHQGTFNRKIKAIIVPRSICWRIW